MAKIVVETKTTITTPGGEVVEHRSVTQHHMGDNPRFWGAEAQRYGEEIAINHRRLIESEHGIPLEEY